MKQENQALRLAQMMQSRVTVLKSYELSLPLVEVGRSKLKKLAVDDVILLGFHDLTCILIEDESIYASMRLKETEKSIYLEIIDTDKKPISQGDSKKYQKMRVSFGEFQCRKLEVGYRVDITHRTLHDVSIIVEGNIYAEGSLVNVDGELAVKIDKVSKK